MILLVFCLAIGCVFTGCSGETATDATTTAAGDTTESNATARTTLTVGFDASFPPMGFTDDAGNYVGFDIDCAKAVANKLGLELKLQPIVWATKDQELSTGKIDMIWNGFTMHVDTRDDDYTWSEPYMKNKQVIVVRANSEYESTGDLVGKMIAIQSGSTAESAVQSKESFYATIKDTIALVDDNTIALTELETNNVDAVVMDSIVANYSMQQKPGQFKVLEEILAEEEYGIGFLKGNTELRDLVQGALNDLAADGTLADISNTWFGEDVVLIGK